MAIGKVTITAIACALILGIITNIVLTKFKKPEATDAESDEEANG